MFGLWSFCDEFELKLCCAAVVNVYPYDFKLSGYCNPTVVMLFTSIICCYQDQDQYIAGAYSGYRRNGKRESAAPITYSSLYSYYSYY